MLIVLTDGTFLLGTIAEAGGLLLLGHAAGCQKKGVSPLQKSAAAVLGILSFLGSLWLFVHSVPLEERTGSIAMILATWFPIVPILTCLACVSARASANRLWQQAMAA